jgi:hypothetical protein
MKVCDKKNITTSAIGGQSYCTLCLECLCPARVKINIYKYSQDYHILHNYLE